MSHLNPERQTSLTRRRFISDSSKALAVGALGTGSIGSLLAACGGSSATTLQGPPP